MPTGPDIKRAVSFIDGQNLYRHRRTRSATITRTTFPHGPSASVKRGIDRTDWLRMDRGLHDTYLDPRDCRPPK